MYCNNCGSKISDDSTYCEVCGEKVTIEIGKKSPKASNDRKSLRCATKDWCTVIACIAIIVVAFVAFGIFSYKIRTTKDYKSISELLNEQVSKLEDRADSFRVYSIGFDHYINKKDIPRNYKGIFDFGDGLVNFPYATYDPQRFSVNECEFKYINHDENEFYSIDVRADIPMDANNVIMFKEGEIWYKDKNDFFIPFLIMDSQSELFTQIQVENKSHSYFISDSGEKCEVNYKCIESNIKGVPGYALVTFFPYRIDNHVYDELAKYITANAETISEKSLMVQKWYGLNDFAPKEKDIVEDSENDLELKEKSQLEDYTETQNTNYRFNDAKIGDYIFFGKYEQNNDLSDGTEDIEWLVLDKAKVDNDGRYGILAISKYALDYKPYHKEQKKVEWVLCSLRRWLNGEFYNVAFTDAERELIVTVNNTTHDAWSYYEKWSETSKHDNTSSDKVFLLSYDEAEKYFESANDRICYATDYAMGKQIFSECKWWLRTQNFPNGAAVYIDSDGTLTDISVHIANNVRPVLWIYVN
ncbi:DUF6273 domain-containing protein [Butyrivibrio sp. JL13D10]|uniref:DUF6273 domain-containing protein n=1 Tax=Butyrivibrio sp. JL13D10 TaxID=3236815 RepID=UPI0038B55EB4